VDIKTTNGMLFRGDFKKSRNLALNFGIDDILTETRNTEYTIGFGYQIKNVIIPFLTGKKKKKRGKKKPKGSTRGGLPGGNNANTPKGNDLDIKFDFAFKDDITIQHYLDVDTAEPTRGTRSIRISPSVDYEVNKRLSLRLFFDYNKTIPKTSAAFPITNTQGGITVRFSLN